MKLEGSLDAFSLPDIFQLLSFTKKTGGLHLASDGCDGVVFFAGGQVIGASADSSRQPLARRLIGAGVVDDQSLGAAVERAAQGHGVGIAKALLEHSAIEPAMLQQAVTDQSVDAIFDLLRWQDGDFAFVMDEGNPDDVGVALSVENVLADADARRASWEAVSQVVPSSQAVLAMPVVLPADPQISREEWSLLALVDGRRTVGELVDLTGSGQFAVVSLLAGLVTRGLVDVRDGTDHDADHVAVVLRRQGMLAVLEDAPFTPIVEPVVAGPVAPAAEPVAAVAEPVAAVAEPVAPAAEPVAAVVEPVADVPAELVDAPLPEQSTGAEDGFSQAGPSGLSGSNDTEGLVTVSTSEAPSMLGGAHVPGDVVPPRPEPFLPKRQAEFDDGTHTSPAPQHMPVHSGALTGDVVGATAVAVDPESSVIQRDPNVNRSLMLRLIAGVRGL